MIRYMKQPNDWTCGPTVLINALKWAGKSFNGKMYLSKFIKATKCCEAHGTFDDDLLGALRTEGKGLIKYSLPKRPSLSSIEEHMARGGAIIVGFNLPMYSKDGEHYTLITDMIDDGEAFKCINLQYIDGETVEYVGRRLFKKLFLRRRKSDSFIFLTKAGP